MSEKTDVALITGGGRGIGAAITARLSKELPVVIVGRREESLTATKKLLEAAGGEVEYIAGDVTDILTVEAINALLTTRNWRVVSLILNAGIGKSGSTTDFDSALFARVMEVNCTANLPLIQCVLPGMIKKNSGTICFISSIAALKGISHDAAYCASKHAQIGLARALAAEYGRYGISVVPICPGFVESEMTDRSIQSLASRRKITPDEARERLEKVSSQRRIIPAEEVAEIVAFVCSGKVPSLSGSPLVLSGGGL